jgi:hypothetical protein
MASAGPQLLSCSDAIGSLRASVFCPEGRLLAAPLVPVVGQPDVAVAEEADAQTLAPESALAGVVVAVPAVAKAARASLLWARVVRPETAAVSPEAATAQA